MFPLVLFGLFVSYLGTSLIFNSSPIVLFCGCRVVDFNQKKLAAF